MVVESGSASMPDSCASPADGAACLCIAGGGSVGGFLTAVIGSSVKREYITTVLKKYIYIYALFFSKLCVLFLKLLEKQK